MPRVRLQRDDGSFLESSELSQSLAEELHTRYFQAIHLTPPSPFGGTVAVGGSGDTHGLPAAWSSGKVVGVSLVQ